MTPKGTMHFKKHILFYSVVILLVFLFFASFNRFVINHDYKVAYEGDCDPYTEICFLYCEDEECIEPFYYTIMERYANEIFETCGDDLTLCDEAYYCPDNVQLCNVIYCDPEFDGDLCETLTEDNYNESFNELKL